MQLKTSMISPQICASFTPTAPPGDWLIQYFKIMKLNYFSLCLIQFQELRVLFRANIETFVFNLLSCKHN